MEGSVIVQNPTRGARQLVLLFHGVGATPEGLNPLAAAVAVRFADAWVVNVRSPEESDLGQGWQWFSVRGVDDANRPARVVEAMPLFVETVRHWQQKSGVPEYATTLLGFSQGAIMALESTQQPEPVAGRVISIAGRFVQPPRKAPAGTRLHLMHGQQDAIMPFRLSIEAVDRLQAMNADVTLDLFPRLGHGIDARVMDKVVERMKAL